MWTYVSFSVRFNDSIISIFFFIALCIASKYAKNGYITYCSDYWYPSIFNQCANMLSGHQLCMISYLLLLYDIIDFFMYNFIIFFSSHRKSLSFWHVFWSLLEFLALSFIFRRNNKYPAGNRNINLGNRSLRPIFFDRIFYWWE